MGKKLLKPRHKPYYPSIVAKRMERESDRSVALIGAALVENSLRSALLEHLPKTVRRQKRSRELVEGLTFAKKIDWAYALGLIGSEARADLEAIRRIRNCFAHEFNPGLDFGRSEILECCEKLKYGKDPDQPLRLGREKFLRAVWSIHDRIESGLECDSDGNRTLLSWSPKVLIP